MAIYSPTVSFILPLSSVLNYIRNTYVMLIRAVNSTALSKTLREQYQLEENWMFSIILYVYSNHALLQENNVTNK
jgi:hypothetical protein